MSKKSIILLIAIAVVLGLAVSMFGSLSTYETFSSAAEKEGQTIVVMGTLDTTKPMVYDSELDANKFVFHAVDKAGTTHQVVFNGTKPDDFERTESLVMTGYVKGDVFYCQKIQMKCPSKYEDQQIVVAQQP